MARVQRGKFITLEGPEGSGKSTQASRLVEWLERQGHPVFRTREPGGTPTGELIREILQHDRSGEPIAPETELLLFNASRAQLVRQVVLPKLEQGTWVVCDRFADSTAAYQGYGRGFDLETVLAINRFAMQSAVPDLTLLFDLPVETGFERLGARHQAGHGARDRIERETLDFHRRVQAGYHALAQRWPDRIRTVDAQGTVDEVSARMIRVVEGWLHGPR